MLNFQITNDAKKKANNHMLNQKLQMIPKKATSIAN